jgi:hypothetical protein
VTQLNRPTRVAIGCAIGLFVAFMFGWLNSWTPLAGTYARDYITLPRCGLALRFGTDMFTSSQDYPWFGPPGTGWVSHPLLCIAAGVPTSYLPPMLGFKLLDCFYLLLHIGIIVVFGRRLTAPYKARDLVVFAAIGLFFPWYAMYVTGQYHALSVLAVALVLAGSRHRIGGFVLSAVAKPVLGPAGLILLLRRHWREALKIGAIVAALTLPFALFGYSTHTGLHWHGHALSELLTQDKLNATPLLPHWDQQTSLATLIDEISPISWNAHLRLVLTIALLVVATFGLHRRPMEVAIALSSLWFFIYYSRGHEYHGTLFVPVFLYLWTEPRGIYRTRWLALLVVVYALPSTWPIWIHLLHLSGPGPDSFAFMRHKSPLLFWLFVGQKPVTGLLVMATIIWKELRYGGVENARIRVPRLENTSAPAAASAPGAP